MLSRKIITISLVLTSAILANVIYNQWANQIQSTSHSLNIKNETSLLESLESIQTKNLVGLEDFSSIVERPLFSVDRRPNQEVVTEETPQPVSALSNTKFILTGLMLSEEQNIALIKPVRADKLTKLKVGESINGWKLKTISKNSVTLKSGGREVTVELSREKHNQPSNNTNRANDMPLPR